MVRFKSRPFTPFRWSQKRKKEEKPSVCVCVCVYDRCIVLHNKIIINKSFGVTSRLVFEFDTKVTASSIRLLWNTWQRTLFTQRGFCVLRRVHLSLALWKIIDSNRKFEFHKETSRSFVNNDSACKDLSLFTI